MLHPCDQMFTRQHEKPASLLCQLEALHHRHVQKGQNELSTVTHDWCSTPILLLFLGTTSSQELFLALPVSIFRQLAVVSHLLGKNTKNTKGGGAQTPNTPTEAFHLLLMWKEWNKKKSHFINTPAHWHTVYSCASTETLDYVEKRKKKAWMWMRK